MNSRPKPEKPAPTPPASWLLLVHRLPPKPAYLRVKIWRRLQGIGAIAVKNSVYAMPRSEQTREDLEWLLRDIEKNGGDGLICEAEIVDGMRDDQVKALFDAARDADYNVLAKELRGLSQAIKRKKNKGEAPTAQLAKLRQRFSEIRKIDFFSATGGMTVEGILSELEHGLISSRRGPSISATKALNLVGKTWVTRQGVHVDRIACAWLIRRFIDPHAIFKFVADKQYQGIAGELRYDMFNAEFTHEGDKCSFEVLLERAGLADMALRAIAEIVHDIDLKDNKFSRPETSGIAHVIAGICRTQSDDEARIERARAFFDDTYEQFRRGNRSQPKGTTP
jgi:hypothetical protein